MTAAQEQSSSAVLPVNTPDLYSLHGDQLRITYSTTSFDGKPRFDYQDATQIHSSRVIRSAPPPRRSAC
jgi:hypothetical protein